MPRFCILAFLINVCVNITAEPFRFAVLPDTQIYSWNLFKALDKDIDDTKKIKDPRGSAVFFYEQTQWLADNAGEQGIKHVIHLGDIVQNGSNVDEWIIADKAMSKLDKAGVSYSMVVGGHDDDYDPDTPERHESEHDHDKAEPHSHILKDDESFKNYLQFFGPQRFHNKPGFGASESGLNTYQLIRHEDQLVIFLNLNAYGDDNDLLWADNVLMQNRDAIAIISVHQYMYDYRFVAGRNGERISEGLVSGFSLNGSDFDGEHIFHTLISKHPNILMIQNGHVHGSLRRHSSLNGADNPVLEIMSNYQDGVNGGQGYMRIYELDFKNNKFNAMTYSPSLDRTRTEFEEFVDSIQVILHHIKRLDLPSFVSNFFIKRLSADSVAGVELLAEHPQYQAEPEYYQQQFADLFGGELPVGVEPIESWEGLWLLFYAKNPKDPQDYSPNFRSPSFSLNVNYSNYKNIENVEVPLFVRLNRKWHSFKQGFSSWQSSIKILLGW